MRFLLAIVLWGAAAWAPPAFAQAPEVSFGQVTAAPIPFESVSGRFSSLNPLDRRDCPDRQVSGRVVTPRLVLADEVNCGRPGHQNLLVNIKLANPADAARLVPGRHVVLGGNFKIAEEERDRVFVAEFLIGENVSLVSEDATAPVAAPFTSYLICQPPELDDLAVRLNSDLCVQSTILADLPQEAAALEAAALAPAKVSLERTVPGAAQAISCRVDAKISDRHLSAISCARNNYWAWYRARSRAPLSSTPAPP